MTNINKAQAVSMLKKAVNNLNPDLVKENSHNDTVKFSYVTKVSNVKMESTLFGKSSNTIVLHVENQKVKVRNEDGLDNYHYKPVFQVEFLPTK